MTLTQRMNHLTRRISEFYKQREQGELKRRQVREKCDALYGAERQWVEQTFTAMEERRAAALLAYEHTLK